MRMTVIALMAISLVACGLRPPSAAQREAAKYDSISGADPNAPGPRGFVASFPPADTSANPLRCRYVGPETVCKRDQ